MSASLRTIKEPATVRDTTLQLNSDRVAHGLMEQLDRNAHGAHAVEAEGRRPSSAAAKDIT